MVRRYEPFGSLLPGRNYSADSYNFGFQGQEKDNELYGFEGTALSFEYRVHDARVGRFLSLDPLASKYPHNSPYAFSENRVIDGRELEGLEHVNNKYWVSIDAKGKPTLELFQSTKAADPGAKGWGVHMRFWDKESKAEITEMTSFAPMDAPWVYAQPNGGLYVGGTKIGGSYNSMEGEDGFWNRGLQTMLGTAGTILSGGSLIAGGLSKSDKVISLLGLAGSMDDVTAGAGQGTIFENLMGSRTTDRLKLGLSILSFSKGMQSIMKSSITVEGNTIRPNKDYDRFVIDMSNVINDEINSIKGVKEIVTNEE